MRREDILNIIKEYNSEIDTKNALLIKSCTLIEELMRNNSINLRNTYEIEPCKDMPYGRSAWRILFDAHHSLETQIILNGQRLILVRNYNT